MTNTQTIEQVTQEDREAADKWKGVWGTFAADLPAVDLAYALSAHRTTATAPLLEQIKVLREALEPFAFLDMGKDEDEGAPFTAQDVWEIIYRDRVRDWFDFDAIETARTALTQTGGSHD